MNDSGARFPEADAVLGSGRGQEVVDLLVEVLGPVQILLALNLGLDQVVAVDGGGHRHLGETRRDELEHGHLGSGVLTKTETQSQAFFMKTIQTIPHNLHGAQPIWLVGCR